MKIPFFALLIGTVLTASVIGFRLYKDTEVKKDRKNTFAIQNVKTGTCVRPKDANYKENTSIILYPHHNWECMTWRLIDVGNHTFLLENLYTEKTFQPVTELADGTELSQISLDGSALQFWEIIEQPDHAYLIRLQNTDYYLTAPSDVENTPVVLKTVMNDDSQRWRLIPQTPVF